MITGIIAIISAASLAIALAVTNSEHERKPYSPSQLSVDNDEQQNLLEVAEHINLACSEHRLNEDMTECQRLCHTSLCCFDSGDYSCEDDTAKDCAVYAGCEALVDGVPIDGVEEDEE